MSASVRVGASRAFFLILAVVFLILPPAILVLLNAPPAAAWTRLGTGCRFDPDNDNDGLGVGISSTNSTAAKSYSTRVAQGYWNDKLDTYGSVDPDFTSVSYGSTQRDVRVEFSQTLPSNVGAVTNYWCGSTHYTQDPLFTWNNVATYYDMHNARLREAVASHELGHTFGLDHNSYGGCDQNYAGLMYGDAVAKSDLCNWAGPSIDDADGASTVHSSSS